MTSIWKVLILICCLLWLVGCQSPNTPVGLTAKVQRVVSGQTLEVLSPSEQSALIEQVRLIGIAAPDLQQHPWGVAAKKKLEELLSEIKGQQLVLQSVLLESEVEEKDRFGRRLAYVWHDGTLVNEQLVAEGYVLADLRSPNGKYTQRLIRAQEYARLMGYGIWNPKQPMRLTPKEFRSKNRK
ncbi:MAG: thermonuclease family protein [Xenococcaceae cyanobacterium]